MTKKRKIVAGSCLIVFIILTYLVSTRQELAFDTVIREWFYSLRTPWLTEVVKGITFMGNTKTIVAICILLLVVPVAIGIAEKIRAKANHDPALETEGIGWIITKKFGFPVAAVAIVGSAINKTIKHIMMRPRPDVSLHLIEQGGWSFPSGHSISGLLLYGFLVWLLRRYVKDSRIVNAATVILTLLWIGIGLSRIYLGVHYPTDVLGGWTLGMVVMMTAIVIIDKFENRVK